MRKVIKLLGIVSISLIALIAILYSVTNEKIPKGIEGQQADDLANKMLKALNHEAYDSTQFIEWDFIDRHQYKWDKKVHKVEVKWDNTIINIYPNTPNKNRVLKSSKNLNKEDTLAFTQKAVDYFNNDSFWLIAPYKIFDKGTERRLVKYNKKDALLVTYTNGGTTPGDSYLWILDENFLPIKFKMWVSIIPIGGIEASWSDWKKTEPQFYLPTKHNLLGFDLDMGKVKAYNN